MAVRLPDGEFVDPFEGVKDLAAKRLDTPLDPEIAFSDDPLRMLRAARFVAQLGVTPGAACGRGDPRDAGTPADRVARSGSATSSTRCSSRTRPGAGLALLVESGLADEFLPELPALQLEQDPVHRHKDVLRHTFAVVERLEPDPVLRLAGLLHDIGKPSTREITPDGVSFHHHEVVGARMAEQRLRELRYPNSIVEDGPEARRAAPPVPRVRRRLDGRRRASLRPRRRPAPRQAEPAHAGGLHHPGPEAGGTVRAAPGRARGTDRAPGRAGEPRGDASDPRRPAGDGTARPRARADRRGSARLPDGGADRARRDLRGRGVRAAGRLGEGARDRLRGVVRSRPCGRPAR